MQTYLGSSKKIGTVLLEYGHTKKKSVLDLDETPLESPL